MKNYDHKKIESFAQKLWDKKKIYKASDGKGRKFYPLVEFPYPSGAGLHTGHIRSYTAMDIISRKKRMEGFNVLYPIGWDAFGLPTENYAIKTGKKPALVTKQNTDTFRRQLKAVGFSFDWSREINTTDPKYYKWTQWIFLQLFKKGLAYKAKSYINWCPKDKIGLANEEAIGGICDRCGSQTEKREKEQWMLAITKYADRLDKDLDLVDYPERVKIQQRNWIGKSEGAEIEFKITPSPYKEEGWVGVKVFTTRADTIFGATYMVLAPEHELLNNLKDKIKNWAEVEKYIQEVKKKSETERTDDTKIKTGVELKGIKAINPASKEEIPVWIADYVLAGYGTGAIMAVPAHDERDYAFAKKYNLSIKEVVLPEGNVDFKIAINNLPDNVKFAKKHIEEKGPYSDNGYLINSDKFTDIHSEQAKKEITKFVGGKIVIKFKLRDWVFSRQRYWGEPIPLVYCDRCKWVPVRDKDLPVKLPEVKSYKPTDTGESPLASITKWVNTKCPLCKRKARRETDTMPNWAGSSWYYLRYTDSKNSGAFASKKNLKYWLGDDPRRGGVDWYNGGMEHTTLHLLYSRFWHKFLYDLKLVPQAEPYAKRTSHGMILGEGGVKMSKSIGNVVNPDSIVKTYGADTLRVYEMFMGPFEDAVAWSMDSIIGSRRFIEKIWRIQARLGDSSKISADAFSQVLGFPRQNNSAKGGLEARPDHEKKHASEILLQKLLHKTIKKISEDIENMRFNTAISAMMILATEMEKSPSVEVKDFKMFLQILAPFAPHIAEHLWFSLGEKKSVHISTWPKWDENLIKDYEIKIAVQMNGKARSEIIISVDDNEEDVKKKALIDEKVIKYLGGSEPKKIIYIKNRVINILY